MIAAYFAASPKVAGYEHREAAHCKQRWHKINYLVNKFCGAYEAASREKSSGQNENDGSGKRRKLDDGAHSSTSAPSENNTAETDQATTRPPGVKASKRHGKQKTKAEGKSISEYQTMLSIRKEDLTMKERLSKIKLLDSLIAKPEPLAEYEEALKQKLITELLS
ncbi:PREDICTED: glutathione S-transferase T3-like [Brassica oleracea var. oleracea]|uniref:glutathione S-transferase T3-like n=1 Tax=Brassica oleracea var. oleracea TaxID=109376 RepID=UPI0006A71AB0|nr:PREDICTED: glutathione S-transferase T3-like [Brassica oleracea var. oleracea]